MSSVPNTLLTRGEAERIVAEGARRYFESRRAKVDAFVEGASARSVPDYTLTLNGSGTRLSLTIHCPAPSALTGR